MMPERQPISITSEIKRFGKEVVKDVKKELPSGLIVTTLSVAGGTLVFAVTKSEVAGLIVAAGGTFVGTLYSQRRNKGISESKK